MFLEEVGQAGFEYLWALLSMALKFQLQQVQSCRLVLSSGVVRPDRLAIGEQVVSVVFADFWEEKSLLRMNTRVTMFCKPKRSCHISSRVHTGG